MPIGISRFHNTAALGGGVEPRGTQNSQNQGAYAQLTSAQEGVTFNLPLSLLPGDVQLGNIVTLTI